ncbi:aminopeptidase P family N-terminal domain-containing protein [Microvirga alba]|uniref:Aminopeptidase P family N-terminal domain-containing protein n=1 Tax=Microvirga alba TaxID=2791025 RepID=A0A931FS64_9HYPH|nr:aminopeptidase P family N-terminal domain-containing protein [Microvirga alba]MBF9235283.1 aminopeptidase P family N-terminal domain-containing protein [Microvirga alba]
MLSMEPAIKRGLTFWDRALMPRDEFYERIRLVRAEMRRVGLDALIVSGNMYEDADLIYLVGGNVDGTLVLTADDDPVIFTVSGSRESFFLTELTWINDVSYQGALIGAAVRSALHARKVTSGRIGTVGLQVLASRPYQDLVQALAGYDLQDFTAALHKLRGQIRPREVAASRIALGMAEKAALAAERAFATGASNAAAVVEAERVARLEGAWDFRALANLDSDDLRPYERSSDNRRGPLLLWVATRYQGYWADRVVATAGGPNSEAATAIAAMTAAAHVGVSAQSVADAGLAVLSDESRRSALAYGLGHGIGIALNGSPKISPQSDERLTEGTLLSFRVFARGSEQPSFATALVQITPNGAVPLEPLAR